MSAEGAKSPQPTGHPMSDRKSLEVRLILPATSGLEVVAAETAAALAEHAGATEGVAGEIRLAVIEGCVNVIEHAYDDGTRARCASCDVDLRFQLSPAEPETGAPTRLTIQIRDNGHGFDLGAYEEPTLEKKLHAIRKRGWGLKLMRGFMDEFQIISGRDGTKIEMTKVLVGQRE